MNLRPSTAACKERRSSNGSHDPAGVIDKKTLEWIEAGLPGLSPKDRQAVLVRFFEEQARGKVAAGTATAKAPSAPTAAPGVAGNAQAQSQRGGNPPVYPPPTPRTQHGGSSYYRTVPTPQPGPLPARQMPTFTYTPPATMTSSYYSFAAQYARSGAQQSATSGAPNRPLPPTWTGTSKPLTAAPKPPTGAPSSAAGGSKSAQPVPRVHSAPREPAAPRVPSASRSSKRKTRSGSLERASVQRSAKKVAPAMA
ncbi:uncharacterized protein SCHCODRAFT_02686172 [Schizophyllum commune H4-8]|uniref:Uncharacterized protein n=1 Tax=Schizophyllum commune (strain H4-8 / FGSC 9210) TaxID=578458 RepID=D8Q2S2_SCHCM|nr:uncharacterized protein SCHCODRAFT_02686172 [Schizophyllum commune H4-8]KAI5894578.1 hypothetical protein SCHCODRAFT_02686172 [Schizophyllum commune H4-8]